MAELRAFVAVSRSTTMVDAAALIGRDAAALSRRLQALESRLGVTLVRRNTRKVALTEDGYAYLDRIAPLITAIDAADADLSDRATGVIAGRIKMTVPSSFGRTWMTPILLSFLERHPAVVLHIDYSDRRVDLVGEGYDLAIRIGDLAEPSLETRHIADRRRVVCVARDHPAAREVTHPSDLTRYRALSFSGRERQQWHFIDAAGEAIAVTVPSILSSNNADLLIEATGRGLGILNTTDWHAHHALQEGRLVELLKSWRQVDAGSIKVVLPTDDPSTRVRLLTECIVDELTRVWEGENAEPL